MPIREHDRKFLRFSLINNVHRSEQMRQRQIAIATILTALAGTAVQVHALDLAGSDTIEDLTIALIASGQCGTGLNYVDGGSGAGENALIAGTQQIAPMSRKVNATTNATCNSTGEGMFFALDAISIVVDSAQTERCGSAGHIHAARGDAFVNDGTVPVAKTTPAAAPAGTLSDMGPDWGTKLLRLYAGNDGSGSASACSRGAHRTGQQLQEPVPEQLWWRWRQRQRVWRDQARVPSRRLLGYH
jgi:ABC-type phosphate transport system substrate-binding protein